jgi:hypothetical protein
MNPATKKRLIRLYTVQEMRPSRIAVYLKIDTREVYAVLKSAGIPLRSSSHDIEQKPTPIRELPAIGMDEDRNIWELPEQAAAWGNVIFQDFKIKSTPAPKRVPSLTDSDGHSSLLSACTFSHK